MLILEVIIGLLAAIAGALIALAVQARLAKTGAEQTAGRIQESQLHTSQMQQANRIAELEARLAAQVQQSLQQQKAVAEGHQEEVAQLKLEHELARLHRVEETPLTIGSDGQHRPTFANWQPAMLNGANLRKRDLSHRYLGHANLREAELSRATLFLVNLSGASLVKSNLSEADLSGADLSGADLSGANLTNANLLVADLHHTVLMGANLIGVRGLTTEQLKTATYDETTIFDADGKTPGHVESIRKIAEMEGTAPRIPSIPQTPVLAVVQTGPKPATPVVTPPAPRSVAEIAVPAVVQTGPKPATPVVTPPAPRSVAETAAPAVVQAAPEPVASVIAPVVTPPPKSVSETPIPVVTQTTFEPAIPVAAPPTPKTTATVAEPTSATPAPKTAVETSAPAVALPEVQSATLLPDMTPFIDQLADPPASSSLTSGDSLLDPAVTDLLVDTPQSTRTGGVGTATPKRKYSGKGAAKAN